VAIFGEIRASKYARGYVRNEHSGPPAGVRDKMVAQGGHDHLDARSYTNDRDVTKGSGGHDLLRVNDGDAMDGAIGGNGV
jgi:hypothetical protein